MSSASMVIDVLVLITPDMPSAGAFLLSCWLCHQVGYVLTNIHGQAVVTDCSLSLWVILQLTYCIVLIVNWHFSGAGYCQQRFTYPPTVTPLLDSFVVTHSWLCSDTILSCSMSDGQLLASHHGNKCKGMEGKSSSKVRCLVGGIANLPLSEKIGCAISKS